MRSSSVDPGLQENSGGVVACHVDHLVAPAAGGNYIRVLAGRTLDQNFHDLADICLIVLQGNLVLHRDQSFVAVLGNVGINKRIRVLRRGGAGPGSPSVTLAACASSK